MRRYRPVTLGDDYEEHIAPANNHAVKEKGGEGLPGGWKAPRVRVSFIKPFD
jgi:hypothetical protein